MTQLDLEDTQLNSAVIRVLQRHQDNDEAYVANAVAGLLEERKARREQITNMMRKADEFYGSIPSFLRVQAL